MTIKPIRNEQDLRAAFKRLDAIFQAPAGTPEAEEMGALAARIEDYESRPYPISTPDPVEDDSPVQYTLPPTPSKL